MELNSNGGSNAALSFTLSTSTAMQDATRNKMAEIIAAQMAAAGQKSQLKSSKPIPTPPQATKPEQPAPPPTANPLDTYREANTVKESPVWEAGKVYQLSSFTIEWHEGTGEFDGRTFTTWKEANAAFAKIYADHEGQGYSKVKIRVKWENGAEIIDRADVGENDYTPAVGSIGEYLSRCNSVMWGSNLQKGDRVKLAFVDEETAEPKADGEECSVVTVDDILNGNFPPAEADEPENGPQYCQPCQMPDFGPLNAAGSQQKPKAAEMPAPVAEAEKKPSVQVVDYSEKAVAVIGDFSRFYDALIAAGGGYNSRLKCGRGIIFPKTKIEKVKAILSGK